MALAAQAYAKSELLWYFRHVGDKLPPPPTTPAASKLTGQLLGQQPKQPQLAEDSHVVSLVAAAAAMYDLLVSGGKGVAVLTVLMSLSLATQCCNLYSVGLILFWRLGRLNNAARCLVPFCKAS